ncbi:hypothetical protein PVK06_048905 [Gossypium arboreum]|uniref:Uncharacterized protein n=1 Tax=Gossypium arboreum TaxID=29729 RepID=A0ABR0MHQ4_GOSAR|nr:hypothetical protein PVK06_048905 [Gossypium arboreum]
MLDLGKPLLKIRVDVVLQHVKYEALPSPFPVFVLDAGGMDTSKTCAHRGKKTLMLLNLAIKKKFRRQTDRRVESERFGGLRFIVLLDSHELMENRTDDSIDQNPFIPLNSGSTFGARNNGQHKEPTSKLKGKEKAMAKWAKVSVKALMNVAASDAANLENELDRYRSVLLDTTLDKGNNRVIGFDENLDPLGRAIHSGISCNAASSSNERIRATKPMESGAQVWRKVVPLCVAVDVMISGIEPYSDDGGSNPLSWEVSRHIQWRTLDDAGMQFCLPSPFSLNGKASCMEFPKVWGFNKILKEMEFNLVALQD